MAWFANQWWHASHLCQKDQIGGLLLEQPGKAKPYVKDNNQHKKGW
jgi:hypothetical protein